MFTLPPNLTDGQSQNIMPPASKGGGGIKMIIHVSLLHKQAAVNFHTYQSGVIAYTIGVYIIKGLNGFATTCIIKCTFVFVDFGKKCEY